MEKTKVNGNEAMNSYHDAFFAKFGEKPLIRGGKDGKLLKEIVGLYGIEKTKNLLREFFDSEDEFIQQTGYTIGVFYGQVNKLLIVLSGKKPVQKSKTSGSENRNQILRLMSKDGPGQIKEAL